MGIAVATLLGSRAAYGGAAGGLRQNAKVTDGKMPTLKLEGDGRYARVVADSPMYLAVGGKPEQAPLIGFVRAGTPIYDYQAQRDGTYIRAGVPFLRPSEAGTVREGFHNGHSEDFLDVFLPAHVGDPPALARQPARAEVDVRYGLFREISVEPGQPGFAFVHCGKVRVLDRRGQYLRVAAELDAGELHGWIDAVQSEGRDKLCDKYAVAARGWTTPFFELPHGYERANEELTAPQLVGMARTKTALFWVEQTVAGPACFGSARYQIDGTTLSISRPPRAGQSESKPAPGQGRVVSVVRASSSRLLVVKAVPVEARGYAKLPKVVGFRPSAAETWYLHKDDCEKELTQKP